MIRIGSPRSVVAAMTQGPLCSQSSQSEMKHLAISILQGLRTSQTSHFLLHVFSNNGCFLWEWIRYLIFGRDSLSAFHNLRKNLIGVVFDSAPAYYDGKVDSLQSALQFVSPPTERDYLLNITKSIDVNAMMHRFNDFWSGLCNDSSEIPQLYLYSMWDRLASAKRIEELIVHRKKMVGKENIIWNRVFLDSEHCCHLLKYPEDYDALIKIFLSFCTSQIYGACCDDNIENDSSTESSARLSSKL